jgi:PAS domain S-box-containing protein
MSFPRRLLLLAGLTFVYFIAGRFGLSLAFVNENASAVWPPTGIAIAACLLAGPWVWPSILAGAFLVNLTTSSAPLPSMLIAVGNTAEALAAAWLVRRIAGGAAAFETTSTILNYVAAAAIAAGIAATVGLAALVLGGLAGQSPRSTIWLTWWTGDLSGALLVTPAIVTWARLRKAAWPWPGALEGALLLAVLIATSYFVFGPTPAGTRSYPLMFMVLPAMLWAALRFGPQGATAAVLLTAAVATAGTLAGFGPFARQSPNESLLLLQAYLGVKMIVMLSLAAEVAGRRAVEHDIRRLNLDLARRIGERTEELQRLHGRLTEAQEVAHIGSWEWDVVSNRIWWSDEMYRVYGLPIGSAITYERYLSLIHPEDRALAQDTVARSAQTGEPFTYEHRVVAADGATRVLHARGRVVLDAHGRPVRMLGVGHDITDRKRAEEERLELVREQAARREAEEANRLKDHFLATLSHELRTPLNALVGWAHMLRDHALDESTRRRAVEAIHRNATIQTHLVSDILDMARIRSGTLSIDARPVPLAPIVEAAIDVLRPAIDARRIGVAVTVPGDARVMGDAQRLQQVFWNVLSNAVKFAPAGGHIVISGKADGDAVEITVEDDGPGIPEAFLPYVFEQFRQADPSLTREHGGLGLGLAISRHLVELHGGTITAANRRQGGAVIVVRLPAATRASA